MSLGHTSCGTDLYCLITYRGYVMEYAEAIAKILQEDGAELSTMMKTPCLRYKGAFIAMMFKKMDALIIKVAPERVKQLIADGTGLPFNFTKKQFKEWVLIPAELKNEYDAYISEALEYAKKN
jgi:hypothetical protein